jgi:thiol-disulfide isomerase/thioredoxin
MKGYVHIIVLGLMMFWFQISFSQNLTFIKKPELQQILEKNDNMLYVLNFWATWCSPCVKELPYFEKVAADSDPSKVKFLLVSLDFPSQIEKKLKPFLKKNNITLDVAVMSDLDYNSWIGMVDQDWQGNLPATLIFNNSRKIKIFHAEPLDEEKIKELVVSSAY